MATKTEAEIYSDVDAISRQLLERSTPPITDTDLHVLLTRNQCADQLRYHVLPNFPDGVLEHALRCQKCNNILTKDGRAFAPLHITRQKVDGTWFYRVGGYNILGWTEDGFAKYQYGTGRGFETASVSIRELCCTDCGKVSKCDTLKPNQDLLSERFFARQESPLSEIRDILPDDFSSDTLEIEIPNYAFRPDQWSKAFLRGLSKLDVAGKKCLEVGVGTGINVIYLLTKSPDSIAISDKEGRCVPLACRNIRRNVAETEQLAKVLPYGRSLELASWIKSAEHDHFDVVYGCLPQVVIPEGKSIKEGDALAHYYEKDRYQSDSGIYGLALNDIFLQQVRPHLNAGGSVVLNLSGRPGQEVLEQLFRKNGFEPNLLHQEVIAQHAETSLESLVTLEIATGRQFEFFADENAEQAINATQAEARRKAKLPVFHRIYVYQGTLTEG